MASRWRTRRGNATTLPASQTVPTPAAPPPPGRATAPAAAIAARAFRPAALRRGSLLCSSSTAPALGCRCGKLGACHFPAQAAGAGGAAAPTPTLPRKRGRELIGAPRPHQRGSPSPPPGAERVGVRWGIPERSPTAHLTLPGLWRGPLPLPPEGRRGEGKRYLVSMVSSGVSSWRIVSNTPARFKTTSPFQKRTTRYPRWAI